MLPNPDSEENQSLQASAQGERMPAPAPPGGAPPHSRYPGVNRFGLAAVAVLSAGPGAAIVFRGEFNPPWQAVPAPLSVQTSVKNSGQFTRGSFF
jgi:hypothetical protein